MNGVRERFGGMDNDAVAVQLAVAKRRRVWKIVIIANAVALVASLVGCLFMMKTQSLHSDIAKMRDEVGETLTMMSLGGANEAVSKYLPRLIDVTARWDRKFASKSEAFRARRNSSGRRPGATCAHGTG